jgi:hypothetical protein
LWVNLSRNGVAAIAERIMELGTGEHVAVGTGGASGIGRSIAEAFGRYGMRVLQYTALSKPGVLPTAGSVV